MPPIRPRHQSLFQTIVRQRQLVFMSVFIMAYVVLFTYVPLWGWTMAFQNYRPGKAFSDQVWVGFQWFETLFSDDQFLMVIRNTLAMSVINIALGFSTAILVALLLNEVKFSPFKRTIQTLSYLPHFLSWVIVAGLVGNLLASDGVVNAVLMGLGLLDEPFQWLGDPNSFWGIVGITNVWKEVGWNSIIYLAAISSVDPSLYEAAAIDGAGRFRKMGAITLPSIRPVIIVLLIMSVGHALDAGFELQYLLGNGPNQETSQTIDVFVVVFGLNSGNYSMAAAAGIFKSVVSIVLLFAANQLARRLGEERLL